MPSERIVADMTVDAVLFDIGGTLVKEAPPGTPTHALVVELIDGATDVLALLRGRVLLGAVTNTAVMSSSDVIDLLRSAGVDDFDVVVTSAEFGVAKPDPAPLLHAARLLGVVPERTLYIGDRATDREAAEAAGMQYRFSSPNALTTMERFLQQPTQTAFERASTSIQPVDSESGTLAADRQAQLIKPAGSLGVLERIAIRLVAIEGNAIPSLPEPLAVAVFAADHGVALGDRVTPWPQEVTAHMVDAMTAGQAAISVLARQFGATLDIVDVGVLGDTDDSPQLHRRAVRRGTNDLSIEAAMTTDEVRRALDIGAETAEQLLATGAKCLVAGEVGIGNTTAAAALIATFCNADPVLVTGRGSGIDDAMLDNKVAIVTAAVERSRQLGSPMDILAETGGLEIAALAGFYTAAAAAGVPVIVDGVIALAALVAADHLSPGVAARCIAGHRSVEPGATVALDFLGLEAVVDLDLRLGEGTGALLAWPIVNAAVRTHREMATFAEVGL